MGQICIKEELPQEPKYEKKVNRQLSQSISRYVKNSVKGASYLEDKNPINISRDIKITIKRSKREDSDTEDENCEGNQSNSQNSVISEQTISHHKNNDQNIDDISPKNTFGADKLNKSQTKSISSKQSNLNKSKKQVSTACIFTGTLGNSNFMECSQQDQNAFDEEMLNQKVRSQRRLVSEPQNKKNSKKQKNQLSVLSDKST